MEERINDVTSAIIGAAIEVHKALGPGMLESRYETRLLHKLLERGLRAERQKDFLCAPCVLGGEE